MATFDPASLFDSTTTEVNDTKILPIPEGEYLAVIESAEVKTWASRDGLSSGLRLDVTWLIDDEADRPPGRHARPERSRQRPRHG